MAGKDSDFAVITTVVDADYVALIQASSGLNKRATRADFLGPYIFPFQVTLPGVALAAGDGQGPRMWIPLILNGKNLIAVVARVSVVSSSGLVSVQIHNVTQAVDMLTTNCTIDAGERSSRTAATPAVIDGANDDVATDDELRFDVDLDGTDVEGLNVELHFA